MELKHAKVTLTSAVNKEEEIPFRYMLITQEFTSIKENYLVNLSFHLINLNWIISSRMPKTAVLDNIKRCPSSCEE